MRSRPHRRAVSRPLRVILVLGALALIAALALAVTHSNSAESSMLVGTRGPDVLSGGRGDDGDRINARDGRSERIDCGRGRDVVTADLDDRPARNCERVSRPQGFVEEFEGGSLDTHRWGVCHWWSDVGCTIAGNDELEWYVPGQVSVENGILRLTAERREVVGADGRTYPFVSGMISSGPPQDEDRARFSFLYGRAEMRARVPSGRGLWSAFWLLPADRESRPEVDVVEVLGGSPSTARMHVHWREDDGSEGDDGRDWVGRDLSSGWHTYAIDWRPGVLVWLVDGVERWRVVGEAVPSEPMYLVANLAVGGWAGRPGRDVRFPAALEIDRIEVRER